MIYNGQECGVSEKPDLFEYDEIDWTNYNKANIAEIFKKMSNLKKQIPYLNFVMNINMLTPDVIEFNYESDQYLLVGIFNLSDTKVEIDLKYQGLDYLTEKKLETGLQEIIEPIVLVIEK